jgi:putative redox protein
VDYTQDLLTPRHHLVADEPIPLGGNDLGPTPFELLQASLASCTVITLRMYCEHKAISVDNILVSVKREKITLTSDNNKKQASNLFTIKIDIQGDVDEKTKKRMLKIAARCPVHQAFKTTPQFKTTLKDEN